MPVPQVRQVTAEEKDKLIDALMLAFSIDPLSRYGMPGPSQYLGGMRLVFSGLGKPAFEHGTVYTVNDFAGGAIWLPPGVKAAEDSLEGMPAFMEPSRVENFVKTLEAMGSHHPDEPHWYLNFIGVDVSRQGEGLGAALMKHVLSIVDAAGCVAYLESSNPQNMSLYERFGFETTARIQIGDCPVVHPMVRAAR